MNIQGKSGNSRDMKEVGIVAVSNYLQGVSCNAFYMQIVSQCEANHETGKMLSASCSELQGKF